MSKRRSPRLNGWSLLELDFKTTSQPLVINYI